MVLIIKVIYAMVSIFRVISKVVPQPQHVPETQRTPKWERNKSGSLNELSSTTCTSVPSHLPY